MNHKDEVLEITFGKANNILRRSLLFSFIVKLGINKCYRCNLPMTLDNYSIEHIESWEYSDTPKELFFDLDNISFSHKFCNNSAGGHVGYSKKNSCRYGHKWTEENTYWRTRNNGKKQRQCRECNRLKAQRLRNK